MELAALLVLGAIAVVTVADLIASRAIARVRSRR